MSGYARSVTTNPRKKEKKNILILTIRPRRGENHNNYRHINPTDTHVFLFSGPDNYRIIITFTHTERGSAVRGKRANTKSVRNVHVSLSFIDHVAAACRG